MSIGYMRLRHLIPNLLTLGNLAFGSWAIALSYEGKWVEFALALGGAMVCDWLDGGIARLLRSESAMGKELDALADLVSFGVAPAFALYNYLRPMLPALPYGREWRFWMVMVPFGLPLFAAWRLARFNATPPETKRFFEGLPTPAHGAFWAIWLMSEPEGFWLHPVVWIGLVMALGGLMVSRLPFLSLKSFYNLPWVAGIALVWSITALWLPREAAIVTGLGLYAIGSLSVSRFVSDG